ncbi:hypothetical protein [Bradyrhizobium sp. Ghvi]|uniref:hypothetical protein n=1 Tax=Bradyrhizobium sp. Ghvi TaxID=1855319 RepID=UPI000B861F94|nr:hypothetical protein [Bradyrhizobium sp. Ghvi]
MRQFDRDDRPDTLPFGENEYFARNVLNGVGRQFLDGSHDIVLGKPSIAELSGDEACKAASNLIEAATKTTLLIKPPSGIGGGIDCALVGRETRFLAR